MSSVVDKTVWDEARLTDPHGQPDKAQRVREMFDAIAPTYERVNRRLSAGRDTYWRRRAVEAARISPADRVLDVACGTGDLARAMAEARPESVVGCDFSESMLSLAATRGGARLSWCRGDALRLPFADGSFTVVSCAFGVRNFQSLANGFREGARVLRPGGRIVILDFSMPQTRILGGLYRFYFRSILPVLACWMSGDRTGAYQYLPRSVSSFVQPEGLARELEASGFTDVRHFSLTCGVVFVCSAVRKS